MLFPPDLKIRIFAFDDFSFLDVSLLCSRCGQGQSTGAMSTRLPIPVPPDNASTDLEVGVSEYADPVRQSSLQGKSSEPPQSFSDRSCKADVKREAQTETEMIRFRKAMRRQKVYEVLTFVHLFIQGILCVYAHLSWDNFELLHRMDGPMLYFVWCGLHVFLLVFGVFVAWLKNNYFRLAYAIHYLFLLAMATILAQRIWTQWENEVRCPGDRTLFGCAVAEASSKPVEDTESASTSIMHPPFYMFVIVAGVSVVQCVLVMITAWFFRDSVDFFTESSKPEDLRFLERVAVEFQRRREQRRRRRERRERGDYRHSRNTEERRSKRKHDNSQRSSSRRVAVNRNLARPSIDNLETASKIDLERQSAWGDHVSPIARSNSMENTDQSVDVRCDRFRYVNTTPTERVSIATSYMPLNRRQSTTAVEQSEWAEGLAELKRDCVIRDAEKASRKAGGRRVVETETMEERRESGGREEGMKAIRQMSKSNLPPMVYLFENEKKTAV